MFEFAQVETRSKGIPVREDVQQIGQPLGQALGAPNPLQRHLGVTVQITIVAALVMMDQPALKVEHVGQSQVKPLGPRRRHDMRRVTREEQSPVTHWLRDEAAQRRDRFLDRRPGYDTVGELPGKRAFSSSQNRSSGQSASSVSIGHSSGSNGDPLLEQA
jgi:hypothetical protein